MGKFKQSLSRSGTGSSQSFRERPEGTGLTQPLLSRTHSAPPADLSRCLFFSDFSLSLLQETMNQFFVSSSLQRCLHLSQLCKSIFKLLWLLR